MNIIIFDFNKSIGGAETFNCRFIRYLVDNGDVVGVVGNEGVALFELLDRKGIKVKKYIIPEMDGFFISPSNEVFLNSFGRQILDDFIDQDIYVLASYFDVLHKAMHVFDGNKRVRILTGLLHPEAWTIWESESGFNSSRAFKPKVINKLWHYQRQLLFRLDRAHAIWYPNDIYRKYNEDYFSVSLTHQALATVPVESATKKIGYNILAPERFMRILWLGRFDFFKNESILSFIEHLNVLLKDRTGMHIRFDLIGYGDDIYEREVKSYENLIHERLEIRFLGERNESDIYSQIECEKYHFGVAMGSSAYHLAMIGLPVLAIDSCVKGYRRLVKGIWLDEASDEFDEGSSLYLSLIGENTSPRKDINIMLSSVFECGFLQKKADDCCDYVKVHHNVDIILPKIRGFLFKSTFSEKFIYHFEQNLPDEFYYRLGTKKNITVAIFGTGAGALKFYDKLQADIVFSSRIVNVKCFFDNNPNKVGELFCGSPVKIFTPDEVDGVDAIVVASDYWPEIKMQIVSHGINPSKVIRAY